MKTAAKNPGVRPDTASATPSSRALRVLPHCTGCGHCVAACRLHALSLEPEHPNGFGRKQALVDAACCSGCGDCLPACPYQALIF